MEYTEKEIEDWLEVNPDAFADKLGLAIERDEFMWCGRQVRVASGIIDLLGVYVSDLCRFIGYDEYGVGLTFVVVEIKRDSIKSNAIGQCVRYARDVRIAMETISPGCVVSTQMVCVGVGDIQDDVLYEANASNVKVMEVKPTFALSGAWKWTDTKVAKDAKLNVASMQSIKANIGQLFAVDIEDAVEWTERGGCQDDDSETLADEGPLAICDSEATGQGQDE